VHCTVNVELNAHVGTLPNKTSNTTATYTKDKAIISIHAAEPFDPSVVAAVGANFNPFS